MASNHLSTKLSELKQQNRLGIMCHAVIGYPSLVESVELIEGMIEAGADIIELQLPFSDPIADGPVIMRANELALRKLLSTQQRLSIISKLANKNNTPIVVMSYFQIVHACGVQQFVKALTENGVSGLIVPDLPPEEDKIEGLALACRASGISFIPVISPNTSIQRIKLNIIRADDLLYCTARQGTTGQKTTLGEPVLNFLNQVNTQSSIAKAVGFGISKESQVKNLIGHAEVAVIGSAIANAVNEGGVKQAIHLVEDLVTATSHMQPR